MEKFTGYVGVRWSKAGDCYLRLWQNETNILLLNADDVLAVLRAAEAITEDKFGEPRLVKDAFVAFEAKDREGKVFLNHQLRNRMELTLDVAETEDEGVSLATLGEKPRVVRGLRIAPPEGVEVRKRD